jgi:FkbM family methyltransferase
LGTPCSKADRENYVFEKLGWQGVCVEPLPDVFELLKKNRQCDCYNVAIADVSSGSLEFIKAQGVEALSGLSRQMTEKHKKTIINEKGKIEKISVKTLSFDDLMSKCPHTHHRAGGFVDFMSIDVEGAEMSILKTIDFDKYHFGLITVENNEEIKGTGRKMKAFMDQQGYKVFFEIGVDIMFVPKGKFL